MFQRFLRNSWPSLIFTVAVLWLMKPLWWEGEVPAFRDSLHFFYPLWVYLESLSGPDRWLPTWNPWDGFGCSLAGEPTSMIFYPLRWPTLLRIGSIEQRFGAFLVGHLLLAYFSFVFVGTKLGWSKWLTQLAAWGFTLSGPVFFQIYNPPFLVGAAWIPFAMLGMFRIVLSPPAGSLHRSVTALGLAFPTTMMLLGGDAQTAYHVFLIAGLLLLLRCVQSLRLMEFPLKSLLDSWWITTISIGLTVGLSAVQICPTWFWLQQSTRSKHHMAINESSSFIDHDTNRIEFAVQPWHYATLLIPQAYGSHLPENTRWSGICSSDGRVWVPSLHVGTPIALVLVGVLMGLVFKKRSTSEFRLPLDFRFAILVALIALLSSFDWGLYQVWSTICPFYGYFRYPAKWLVFVAWGICAAVASLRRSDESGGGFSLTRSSQAELENTIIPARCFAFVFFIGLALLIFHIGVVFVPFIREPIYTVLQRVPLDPLCGSIRIQAVVRQWGWSGIELLFIGALGFAYVRHKLFRNRISLRLAITVLTMIQLWMIARNQLVTIESTVLREAVRNSIGNASEFPQWHFGDQTVKVATDARLPSIDGDSLSLAKAQADVLFGRLHLLQPWNAETTRLRKIDAEFTLPPRIVKEIRRHKPRDFWSHEIVASNAEDSSTTSDVKATTKIFDVAMEGHRIQFRIQADEDIRLIFPVLDDGGWDSTGAYGLMEPNRTLGRRLEFMVRRGEHLITLHYFPPGLQYGLWIAGVFLSGVLIWLSNIRWRENHEREKQLSSPSR